MSDKIPFSLSFQYSLIRLMLEDESFFLKASKYFVDENPFESDILWFFFTIVKNHYYAYGKLPGEVPIHSRLKEIDSSEIEQYKKVYAKIKSADLSDADYIRKHLPTFIKRNIFMTSYEEARDIFNDKSDEDAYSFFTNKMLQLNSVNFDVDNTYTTGDITNVITAQTEDIKKKVKLGIRDIDDALVGGVGAGEVFTIIAKSGIGKSMFLMNVGSLAMILGKKVLHIHCEGKKIQPILRYCSRMCEIEYRKIISNDLNHEEWSRIKAFQNKYKDQLVIKPFLGIDRNKGVKVYKNTIQDVVEYCLELKKEFDFDIIIIDYGDKLGSREKVESKRFVWEAVWEGMEQLAFELDIPIFTASQVQRSKGSGTKPLHGEHMAESLAKERLSAVVMSINRSSSEMKNNKVRFFLSKDRDGPQNICVVCESDYAKCCTHLLENQSIKDDDDDFEIEEENGN